MTDEELWQEAARQREIVREDWGRVTKPNLGSNLLAILDRFIADRSEEAAFDQFLTRFDTRVDSEVRDADPILWAALCGVEIFRCVPAAEMRKDPAYWVLFLRMYARAASRLIARDYGPRPDPHPCG